MQRPGGGRARPGPWGGLGVGLIHGRGGADCPGTRAGGNGFARSAAVDPPPPPGSIERRPRANSEPERAFLALGEGARDWLIVAAAAGVSGIHARMQAALDLRAFGSVLVPGLARAGMKRALP